MHGGDAGDTIDVHNGDGGKEVEVEGKEVDLLLGLHDGDVCEVLVEAMDDVEGFEDRCDLDLVVRLEGGWFGCLEL